MKPFDKVSDWSFETAKIAWYLGGKTNVSVNCLDRHLKGPRKNKAALIWEGDSPEESRTITYQQLYDRVNEMAALLRDFFGLKAGDRVTIHMPLVAELPITILACSRPGVVHSVFFVGFSGAAC